MGEDRPPGRLRIPLAGKNTGNTSPAAWNTAWLPWRVGADLVSAGAAAVLVAPLITMIDRGIIENASGRRTLGASLTASLRDMVFRPHRFFFSRPFALVSMLYFGTYYSANAVDTLSSTRQARLASSTTSGAPKFLVTSATNLTLCLYKDKHFTRLFGAESAKARGAVPWPTLALFALRDAITIFASFNMPQALAPPLARCMTDSLQQHVSSLTAAQFVAPAALQLASTPLHLLGLDMYNRRGRPGPDRVPWADRAAKVAKDWGKSSVARMGRIVPAFGVGGVVNRKVREALMVRLD